MTRSGKLILIEGGEANGKSTIGQMITDWLNERDIENIFTHEPGGSGSDIPEIVAAEEHIRKILVSSDLDLPMYSQLLLFCASRNIHMERKVLPALRQGIWVVTDRLHPSTYVYQGIVGGLPLEVIQSIEDIARNIEPDLTIILTADIEEVMKRLSQREAQTKQDAWGRKRQQELINGYKQIADRFDYPIIDSSGSPKETFAQVEPFLQGLVENN